tara:strand:- start:259 stop:1047 length:789 start_codon:yes stop_codon:yes gene_type:complete
MTTKDPIRMKQLSYISGSEGSAFFIDKKRRLWKKRTEIEQVNSIDIELRHLRIMNLPPSEFLLQPVDVMRTGPLTTLICMDYAGPDLFDYMRKPFKWNCMQNHLVHIRKAIHFLHFHGIAHRDIKPENVIFHKGTPKLIDWDFSSRLDNFQYCGTVNYMVDKLIVNSWKCSNTIKSKRMDIYAFGKLVLSVLLAAAQFQMIHDKSFVLNAFFNEKFLTNPYKGEWGKWASIALKCCKCKPPEYIPERIPDYIPEQIHEYILE